MDTSYVHYMYIYFDYKTLLGREINPYIIHIKLMSLDTVLKPTMPKHHKTG